MRIFPRITICKDIGHAKATWAHMFLFIKYLRRCSPFLKQFSSEQTPCQLQSTQPLHRSLCLRNNTLFTTKYIKLQGWRWKFGRLEVSFNVTFDQFMMHRYYNTKSQVRVKKPRTALPLYFQTLTDYVEVLLQVKERNPTGMQTFPCQL